MPHLLRHGPTLYNGNSPRTRDNPTCYRAFGSGAVTTCFYELGLSRPGIEPRFPAHDANALSLRHHGGLWVWIFLRDAIRKVLFETLTSPVGCLPLVLNILDSKFFTYVLILNHCFCFFTKLPSCYSPVFLFFFIFITHNTFHCWPVRLLT